MLADKGGKEMKISTSFKFIGGIVMMIFLLVPYSATGASSASDPPVTCEEIAKIQVPNAIIKATTVVLAGAQQFVQSPGYPTPQNVTLPAEICRVQGTAKPTSDSRINFELWVPARGWNQKIMVFGNRTYSGLMNSPPEAPTVMASMASQIARGYATLVGDSGHDTDDMMFVVGHPEKMADWGFRSINAITKAAKYILTASKGTAPKYSYYQGCSTGGHQGLAEAQRYPEDFDGILVGAPCNNRLRLNIGFLNMFLANHNPGDNINPIIPISTTDPDPVKRNKLPMIQAKVIEMCDTADGVQDGIMDDPRKCVDPVFDAARDLQCHGADAPNCLTAAQVTALNKLHSGAIDLRPTVNNVTNPNYKKPIYQWPKGVEASMLGYMGLSGIPARTDFWRYWVFDKSDWNWWTFDFNRNFTYADFKVSSVIDNINPNLKPFKDRKGKMIIYHGWADGVVSATDTALYYDNVVKTVGGTGPNALADTQSFIRLFLVPGMDHCSGGFCPTGMPAPASSQNDWIMALENWVENGVAPDMIIGAYIASDKVDMTRPICAYPKIAKYKGPAPANLSNPLVKEASNWFCENP